MDIRILVVDDELDTLNLLKTILEISGYKPITTLNSVDAITLAEIEKPDVVLLDIMMPKLDGFTLCKMMRDNLATQHLPIIFVTAYSALDLEERRVESGGDMVINKPIDMDVLIHAIREAIKMRLTHYHTGPLVLPASMQTGSLSGKDPAKRNGEKPDGAAKKDDEKK